MAEFIGFNTINKNFPPFSMVDVELVKRDLLNEFHTRLGERVMNPEFGTIIFDLLMEPSDAVTKDAIISDVKRIIKKEIRVVTNNIVIQDFDDAIIIEITITYTPTNVQETLYVTYQRFTQNETTLA